jgi:hypothetical protein
LPIRYQLGRVCVNFKRVTFHEATQALGYLQGGRGAYNTFGKILKTGQGYPPIARKAFDIEQDNAGFFSISCILGTNGYSHSTSQTTLSKVVYSWRNDCNPCVFKMTLEITPKYFWHSSLLVDDSMFLFNRCYFFTSHSTFQKMKRSSVLKLGLQCDPPVYCIYGVPTCIHAVVFYCFW